MQRIGRYELVGEVGRGAMGVVYRAKDPSLGRTVAVKTIRLGALSDQREREQLRNRLRREAQSAGMLSHPNIVTIYDIVEQGEEAFVFMEFVDGPTLESMLQDEGGIPRELILPLLKQVAAALDYAHSKQIVHRDIKPANIMVHERGQAKITDFGIAKIQSQRMTQTGVVMGTPNYMAPEQIAGQPVTGKVDQFALAVIVYELLTGERPFTAESMPTLLFRIVTEEPVAPQRVNPSLGHALEGALRKGMAKKPEDRYATCTELLLAVDQALQSSQGWKPLPPGSSQSLPTIAGAQKAAIPAEPAEANATLAEPSRFGAAPPAPVPVPVSAPAPAPLPVPLPASVPRPGPMPGQPPAPAPVSTLDLTEDEPARAGANRKYIAAGVLVAALLAGVFYARRGGDEPAAETPVPAPATASKPATPNTPQPPATKPSALSPAPAKQGTGSPTGVQAKSTERPATPAEGQPKPGAREASVQLETNPAGATITFDNDSSKVCVSPCTMLLPPGRHTLEAKLEGFRPALRAFMVPNENSLNLNMEQAQGMVQVSSTPNDAQIFVDGQLNPKRTPAILKLSVGPHKIEVVKEGFQKDTSELQVRDNATYTVNVNWEQK